MTGTYETNASAIAAGDNGPARSADFEDLVTFMQKRSPAVERVRIFGFDCLRVSGKVFAKLHGDRIVVKLTPGRIAQLAEAGDGHAYSRSEGRGMKDWAEIVSEDRDLLRALAEEARLGVVHDKRVENRR